MYKHVGQISEETKAILLQLAGLATWKQVQGSGRDYETAHVEVSDLFDWQDWHGAFFLKIPPGGRVHRHIDVDHPWGTYHVVLQTNDMAASYMAGEPYHLLEGEIYAVDRQVEHWSVNLGKTDRIHLLAEVYE